MADKMGRECSTRKGEEERIKNFGGNARRKGTAWKTKT
jgi:hypothetical protein